MSSHIARAAWYGLGAIALVLSVQGQALASDLRVVPEIDGSTLAAGLGLVSAGVMIIRSRIRSKKQL